MLSYHQWPGYISYNKQKHALRATRDKQSVSLAKVALHVAEVIKEFINVRPLPHTLYRLP